MQTHNLPLRNRVKTTYNLLAELCILGIQPARHRLNRLILALKESKFTGYARTARQKIRRVLEHPGFFHYLMSSLVLLNFFDAALTYYILSHGISQEYNPIVASMISRVGLGITMLFKTAIVPISAVLLLDYPFIFVPTKHWHLSATLGMAVGAVSLMLIVVIGNTLVILGVIE